MISAPKTTYITQDEADFILVAYNRMIADAGYFFDDCCSWCKGKELHEAREEIKKGKLTKWKPKEQ